MKYIIYGILALALTGCMDEAAKQQNAEKKGVVLNSSNRVKVERIALISDSVAYNSERGIYIITDTYTGKEYIGVSGIGITETGSHSSGKSTTQDER